ncbi:MAG: hypothetical protein V2I33_25750 [Kangiellaceae bacterium]|nr:hypothetical protein [Kangiellaceae bacterium]
MLTAMRPTFILRATSEPSNLRCAVTIHGATIALPEFYKTDVST